MATLSKSPFIDYLRDLRANVARGDATEHTHRPALKALLEAVEFDHFITDFPEKGSNEVDWVAFFPEDGRDGARPSKPMMQPPWRDDLRVVRDQTSDAPTGSVHINTTQTFGGITHGTTSGFKSTINHHKSKISRKGRTLDYGDLQHYQKIVVALSETIKLMTMIDQKIELQGGWPLLHDTDHEPSA